MTKQIHNTIAQALAYQKKHDSIWDQNMADKPDYKQIKASLIEQAKYCTAQIKHYESKNEQQNKDQYIKDYSQIIEVYREFYHY